MMADAPRATGSAGIGAGGFDAQGDGAPGDAGQSGEAAGAGTGAWQGGRSGAAGAGGPGDGAGAGGAAGQGGARGDQSGGAGTGGGASEAAGGAEGRGGAGQNGGQGAGVMVAAARPEPREFTVVTELNDVHFDFDRYDIRPEEAATLAANAAWLLSRPGDLVLIEGHCDSRGTNDYNLALGQHRAESTMNYLISQGVQASRITVISYGEERPLCAEDSDGCWARNRRAHFLVKRR